MPRRPVLALLVLLAVSACGAADDPSPPDTGAESAPPVSTAPGATTPVPPAGTPVALPFADGYDWRIAIAPDGVTALVAWSDGFFPRTRESTIYQVTRQADGSWDDPVEPSFVSARSSDIDPFFTADGTRLWFSSIRPVAGTARPDVEVWYADRQPDGSWAPPVHAPAIGSDADDLFPSVGPDGALYVGSDRDGGDFDIWRAAAEADGGWAAPSALPLPVTTSSWEFNPVLSPDGSVLVFTAQGRAGGAGAGDLFASRAVGESWSEPAPLTAVNTSDDEYHPAYSPDGTTFYFVRDGDLLEVPVADLGLPG